MPWSGFRSNAPTIVRCREGHLFSTVWVPLASFKAIRLGPVRFQRCPVGNHWTFVRRVRDDELSDAERVQAEASFDGSGL